MLLKLKKVNIENTGYKRKIRIENVFVNPTHIISVRDYRAINEFLLLEGSEEFSKETFSLVKLNNVTGVEEVIALGSSKKILEKLEDQSKAKGVLNG